MKLESSSKPPPIPLTGRSDPSAAPTSGTLSKIFNGNAVEDHQRISLNPCNFSKMPPFQILDNPSVGARKKKKSRNEWGGASRGWGELGYNHHFVFNQKGGFCLKSTPPTWRTRLCLFVRVTFDLSSMGDLTSSYVTASIALRVIWSLKPHHYTKQNSEISYTSAVLRGQIFVNTFTGWMLYFNGLFLCK